MPPKQQALPDANYTHEYNIEKFQLNQSKFPVEFDKKIPREFLDLYYNALVALEMVPVPCLVNQLQQLKPLRTLNIFSLIIDQPSCQVISECLQESLDVQNITIMDCIFDDRCLLSFFSFLSQPNSSIQNISFVELHSNLNPVLASIMLGENRVSLKIFKTALSEPQMQVIHGYVGLFYNNNLVGLSLPSQIPVDCISSGVKFLEVNEGAVTYDQVTAQLQGANKGFDYTGLQTFVEEHIFKQLFSNKDIKLADPAVSGKVQQLKQLLESILQLLRVRTFEKFENIEFTLIKHQLDNVYQELRAIVDMDCVVDYLVGGQEDRELELLARKQPFRTSQLEYLGYVDYEDERRDFDLGQLKAIGLGQELLEAKEHE